ncbi:hypothetical protein E2C01_004030 [Portunus trituberculatus]|uniref:Uncharacterized protein n=1 Tax=Portunus trituberculatus TaxID=210409 RepID=A0A5B7CNS9_PORTR|nr:hypothetical protein [Portunus trituberculatus]
MSLHPQYGTVSEGRRGCVAGGGRGRDHTTRVAPPDAPRTSQVSLLIVPKGSPNGSLKRLKIWASAVSTLLWPRGKAGPRLHCRASGLGAAPVNLAIAVTPSQNWSEERGQGCAS